MADKQLVTIELRFVTEDEPEPIGDRVREAVAMIVGRDALEEYRVRAMPLAPPKRPRAV
ncbi:MAG TPA: hypothetical protein VEC15_08340 [Actinomycetota bacterium]|jgi:hypothetical protein|nr:hypothetical protein [Actinomycetota bacterium]